MNQITLDTAWDYENAAEVAVKEGVKLSSRMLRTEIEVRSCHEAYGVMAEAEMRLLGISKKMKKSMEAILETLERGVDTPGKIADVEYYAEQMAIEAVLMAAKGKVCIDDMTGQDRRPMDPETGEIYEEDSHD